MRALLAPLTDYERRRPERAAWSLDNMNALLAADGLPRPSGRLVQVGGSKGKGTTSLYLESLARAAGLRTGTYLSPHLQSVLERVRVLGQPVSAEQLLRALEPVLACARVQGLDVTFFDAMTRAALSCFAAAAAELGILEVGLGGRLDSTTAVPVDASILTAIELEHTGLLGSTLEAIAAEKAWVLRPGRPGFTSAEQPALGVLRGHAARVGADLAVLGEDFALEEVRDDGDQLTGRLRDLRGRRHDFLLRGAARFELPALALAAACLWQLYPELPLPLQPVPRPALPGRFERLVCRDGTPLILDAAHTEQSTRALAAELARRYPARRRAVLFASAADKRWREALKWLVGSADTVVVTALTDIRGEAPGNIVDWLAQRGVPAETAADTGAGMLRLAELDGVRVVTGSFYLVGAARALLDLLGASAAE